MKFFNWLLDMISLLGPLRVSQEQQDYEKLLEEQKEQQDYVKLLKNPSLPLPSELNTDKKGDCKMSYGDYKHSDVFNSLQEAYIDRGKISSILMTINQNITKKILITQTQEERNSLGEIRDKAKFCNITASKTYEEANKAFTEKVDYELTLKLCRIVHEAKVNIEKLLKESE